VSATIMPITVMLAVCPSVCCSSRGHISKTKQDRRMITMEHYTERGAAYSNVAFRLSPGEIVWFQIKHIVCSIY